MKTRIIFEESTISKRIDQLAKTIQKDYKNDHFILLGVLNGSFVFVSDLSKALFRNGATNFSVDFIGLSSYGSQKTSSRAPQITKKPIETLKKKHIVLVEDIVDTGISIAFLQKYLKKYNCLSIRLCALLSKPDRREAQVTINYLGFEIKDIWVEGYGMDTGGYGRGNPEIVERLEK